MIRFIAQTIITLLANAVGLIVASLLFSGFSIDTLSFVVAVVIFTAITVVLGPFVISVALKYAPYLMGGIALVTILVGLMLTSLLTDGITINGLGTWIGSTLVIWVFSLIANVLLPLVIFKKTLEKKD